jgi:hypothetical protein
MPSIVAAIVTHKRPAELRRLLKGLAASELPLTGCVISDHAPDGLTHGLARATPWETVVLEDPSNPGPGAGWANAARQALVQFPDLEALWYLDDDVVISATDLGLLWQEMERGQAGAIAPLLEGADEHLWAFPEPVDRVARQKIREARTAGEARKLLGAEPLPFCWCTGACFLVSRTALDSTPLHRTDFWMLGEDLEYSMRIAAKNRAVFTCLVAVPHLPPKNIKEDLTQRTQRGRETNAEMEAYDLESAADHPSNIQHPTSKINQASYLKFCSLLQNLSYLSFHAEESRHMKSYLPGNFRRFLRTHGLRWQTLQDALSCLWHGAVRGRPAGGRAGHSLRQRASNRKAS